MTSPTATASARQRRRLWIFMALAVSLGISAAVVLSEFALRVYVAGRGWTANCYATGHAFFVPDPNSGHTLRPGLRLKSSTYDIRVNSLGLRGPEIPVEKPPGVTRIAVLGGSSVFGYLVPEGQDSCRLLETLLSRPRHPIQVLNAGVPGFNMTQCRHRYEQQIVRLAPDLVVLYLGWNDSLTLIAEDPTRRELTPPAPNVFARLATRSTLYGILRYRLFAPQAPRFAPPPGDHTRVTEAGARQFESELQKLLTSIQRSGATPVISTQLMASNPKCKDLNMYLGDHPAQIAANQRIGRWITETMRRTAQAESVTLIDCAAELNCDPSLLGDAIHLTRQGHAAIAECWSQHLRPMLPPVANAQATAARIAAGQSRAATADTARIP